MKKNSLNKFDSKKLDDKISSVKGGIVKTEITEADTTDWVRNRLLGGEVTWVHSPDGWARIVTYP